MTREQSHATWRSGQSVDGTALPRDPGGKTMEQSHATRRSGRNDDDSETEPHYPDIRAKGRWKFAIGK